MLNFIEKVLPGIIIILPLVLLLVFMDKIKGCLRAGRDKEEQERIKRSKK